MTSEPGGSGTESFAVRLENFEGPFDLLLTLIAKHQMDVTEVALAAVTDEFIAHLRERGADWDLGQASSFLVVAATLLEMKASRLLPGTTTGADEEDLELLAERDLLYARLLEYSAFRQAAGLIKELAAEASRRYVRTGALEPRYADILPEVVLAIGPHHLAALAAAAMTPRPEPVVMTEHVHSQRVSVREQAALLRERLSAAGAATFADLIADCDTTLLIVGRFLALLELYVAGVVTLDQDVPLDTLRVAWRGGGAEPAPSETVALQPEEIR